MRYFNTSGPNIVAEHYTLMRSQLVAEGADKVYKSRYFTIWAPRQTGKSTYFQLLASELENEGYKVAYINFENYKTASIDSFVDSLVDELNKFWQIRFLKKNLQNIFQDISNIKDKKNPRRLSRIW